MLICKPNTTLYWSDYTVPAIPPGPFYTPALYNRTPAANLGGH